MAANAKERLELALEASNEGIWDWDFESGALDVTPRVAEFFQCQREEVPNFFVELDLIHSDERESFKAAVAAIRAGESDFLSAEPRIYCEPDKEWKWFRVRGVAVCFEGKVKGIAGSLIDISGRKEAELALLEEQHLTRTLIENVPLQIYFKDLESKFVMVNTPMAQWIGKGSPDEIVGKSDKDFFEEEHWRQALEDEKEIMETGKAQESYIEREIWAGKEETWVLTTKMPYRGPRGTLLGTFGVSSDVTELVQTQKSLAELAAELKQRNQAYEEEVSLAREIQQGLLPREYPEVNTAKFGHRYLPISGLAGDFFEVFKLGENKVALLICDVMGHGVRSALVASLLRGLISQARDLIDEPAKFLNALNQGLVDYLSKAQVTMFTTAFHVVVDYEAETISYASAGHPAGIQKTEEGASRLPMEKERKGPGLGLMAEAQYEKESIPLSGVETLLLFTDGIYEVENAEGEAFLQNRLVETVDRAGGLSLEDLLEQVLSEVKVFTEGGGFDDDVCLLAMQL